MLIETKQKWPIITIAIWYVDVTKLQMFKGINCLSFKLPYKQWFQHKQMNSDIFVSLVNRNNRSHCSNQFNRGNSRNLKKISKFNLFAIYVLFYLISSTKIYQLVFLNVVADSNEPNCKPFLCHSTEILISARSKESVMMKTSPFLKENEINASFEYFVYIVHSSLKMMFRPFKPRKLTP